jgi:hypothetical protein
MEIYIMQKITIQKEATIKAKGTHKSKLCKPVICIETGEVFASATDAAERVGVHYSMMSASCTGKVKTCKGKHYCYLNAALENLDAVMTRLRQAAAMEEDAKKWRAQEAELEAARKAEERRLEEERKARERHEAAVAKARAKVVKLTENCEKLESKLLEEERALMNAEIELENLLGEEAQQVA